MNSIVYYVQDTIPEEINRPELGRDIADHHARALRGKVLNIGGCGLAFWTAHPRLQTL